VRQIIVSVLCEPNLIPHVLESTAVTEEGLIPQSLPKAVLDLLQAIQDSEFQGLSLDRDRGSSEQSQLVSALLVENGFKPERFLEEGMSQLSIGGHRHEKVVKEIQMTSARFSIKDEIKQLRHDESKTRDVSELERLAQEKLMKKRSMKKLTGPA
jgi:hypothetical protein